MRKAGACFRADEGMTEVKKHTNAFYRIARFLKDVLKDPEKNGILETNDDRKRGMVPHVAPITLLRHDIAQQDVR